MNSFARTRSNHLLEVLSVAGFFILVPGLASSSSASTAPPSSFVLTTSTTSPIPPTVAAALNPALVSTGLKNMGNTCYLNAQLQCAFHIPKIRALALESSSTSTSISTPEDDEPANDCDNDTKESSAKIAWRELMLQMIQAADQQLPPVAPRSFCLRLGIAPMVQQDSQEFWKLLLPAMNDEATSDLYKGCLEEYITALDGSHRERRREELYLDLSLDISSSKNIMDSLRASYGEPELLSAAEGNGWRPEKGADKVDAHKGSILVAKGLPSVLQFHLKRFNYDWQTDMTSKLNNRFTFPTTLDLSSVCKSTNEEDATRTTYELQSIVVHMGEYGRGHYYAYVRPDIRNDAWYRFNDNIVEKVALQDVLEDAYGGQSNGLLTGDDETSNSPKGGLFRRLARALSGGVGASYGYGGRTSNAYIVQYVRKCDIYMLYP